MKHQALIIAALTLSISTLAQNVGIGTNAPAYKLDVVGRMRVQASVLGNASTGSGIWFTDHRSNDDIVFVGMADSVNAGLWSSRAGIGWQFYFDARYGNVGIGRKPSSGSGRLSLDHPSGASLNVYANGIYRGGFQATDSTLEIFGTYGSSLTVPQTPGKNIIIWPGPPPCTGQFCLFGQLAGKVGMYTNDPNSRVHISAGTGINGVLIGNAAAQAATGYMLNVDGKIICEELKVQTSALWPDYVFEENYLMPGLDELEKKVMQEKHLPNILSAAQIDQDKGYEIGAMQTRMLEKIEELYRYMFILNKENKALKMELASIKKQ